MVLAAVLGIAALAVLFWVYVARRRRLRAPTPPRALPARIECRPQRPDRPPSPRDFSMTRFNPAIEMHPTSREVLDQPRAWRRAMRDHGRLLHEAGVGEVTFVHGTFVGTDPFALLRALEVLSPRWRFALDRRLRGAMKRATDVVAKDGGNFDAKWVRLFEDSVQLPTSLFVWTSENHHAARLSAAVRLAEHLVTQLDALDEERPPRALLVGHSHAGQVFALLLQLVHQVEHAPLLYEVAGRLGEDLEWLTLNLERLRRIELDVVTLGTPVRYGWPEEARSRLLHIVNHRGEEPRGGRLDGVTTTRDGDYIQQWGIAGSDLLAATAELRALNAELDGALGPGWSPKAWLRSLKHQPRVHEGGHTLLVDYGDESPDGRPNFVNTNFGHSIYTRRHAMEYLVSVIERRLYR